MSNTVNDRAVRANFTLRRMKRELVRDRIRERQRKHIIDQIEREENPGVA